MSSGRWAGEAAADFALAQDRRDTESRGRGTAGVRPELDGEAPPARDIIAAVQAEVVPFEKNLFRDGAVLRASLASLDTLWDEVRRAPAPGPNRERQRSREAAALVAHARWAYASALRRTESRGMHHRVDHPASDPTQRHRQIVSGLHTLTFRDQPVLR